MLLNSDLVSGFRNRCRPFILKCRETEVFGAVSGDSPVLGAAATGDSQSVSQSAAERHDVGPVFLQRPQQVRHQTPQPVAASRLRQARDPGPRGADGGGSRGPLLLPGECLLLLARS